MAKNAESTFRLSTQNELKLRQIIVLGNFFRQMIHLKLRLIIVVCSWIIQRNHAMKKHLQGLQKMAISHLSLLTE